MKPEYKEGAEARKNFEETMQKLFRAPKPVKTAKPTAKVLPRKENDK